MRQRFRVLSLLMFCSNIYFIFLQMQQQLQQMNPKITSTDFMEMEFRRVNPQNLYILNEFCFIILHERCVTKLSEMETHWCVSFYFKLTFVI